MTTSELPVASLQSALTWCLSLCVTPTVRSMYEWAEDEIILPNGPFSDEPYRHYRHPVSAIFFREIDSGRWSRVASTGPAQNGKTVMCYVIPVLYHLFELKETVIVGLPSMDMANDKWTEDFLPVIEASAYRDLLPATGEGSRGGQVKRSIKFRNGATMRFMTAGGNDKKRSAYTSRVVAITETDGMDTAGESSREADKIEQIEARTAAYGRTGKKVYLECTVSIETGRIWQEKKNGTDSRIARKCKYCGDYVTPEREDLRGWMEAESEEQAAKMSRFHCPSCDHAWTDQDRTDSWSTAVLVHRGQEIDRAGVIHGPIPETQTLGFRWSAIDNPFTDAGSLGAEEWKAFRSRDRENSEKKMRQFFWALPYISPDVDLTPLDVEVLEQRTTDLKKGMVPDAAEDIAVCVDTGKRMLHWTALAMDASGASRVIEYGKQPVDSDQLGIKRGLVKALVELGNYFAAGWSTESGRKLGPSQVWIDSGWHEHTDAVYEFCAAANQKLGLAIGSELYRPTKGYGLGQRRMTPYRAPDAKSKAIRYVGNQFHIAKVVRNGKPVPGVLLVHMNTDFWKSELHQRLLIPSDEELAVTLYNASSFAEHSEFVRHLTAEKQIEKYVKGKGESIVWERVNRQNHWFDSTYGALCASEAISVFRGMKPKQKETPRSLRDMAGGR